MNRCLRPASRPIRAAGLYGDEAIEMSVPRLIDHTHSTLAELSEDLVVRQAAVDHENPGWSISSRSDVFVKTGCVLGACSHPSCPTSSFLESHHLPA